MLHNGAETQWRQNDTATSLVTMATGRMMQGQQADTRSVVLIGYCCLWARWTASAYDSVESVDSGTGEFLLGCTSDYMHLNFAQGHLTFKSSSRSWSYSSAELICVSHPSLPLCQSLILSLPSYVNVSVCYRGLSHTQEEMKVNSIL